MQRGLPFLKSIFRKQDGNNKKNQNAAQVPPPTLPFPWQVFQIDEDADEGDRLAKHTL